MEIEELQRAYFCKNSRVCEILTKSGNLAHWFEIRDENANDISLFLLWHFHGKISDLLLLA